MNNQADKCSCCGKPLADIEKGNDDLCLECFLFHPEMRKISQIPKD